MRKPILCLLLLVATKSFTQIRNISNITIDDLLKTSHNYRKEDSLKVTYLRDVFRKYFSLKQPEKARPYFDSAIAIAKKVPAKDLLYLTYHRIALGYHGLSNYEQALYYYNMALSYVRPETDKNAVAGTYLNKGAIYMDMPDYIKSLEAHQQAIAIFSEIRNSVGLSSCYMNIATLYSGLKQYRPCYDYTQKALKLFLEINPQSRGVAVANEMLANTYMRASEQDLQYMKISPAQKYDIAIGLLAQSIPIAEQQSDLSLKASLMADIGKAQEAVGHSKEALTAYTNAIEEAKKANETLILSDSYISLGNYFLQQKDLQKAFGYVRTGYDIAKKIPALFQQEEALKIFSKLHEQSGRFDSSLMYYRSYIAIRDSVYNQEKEKEITRKQQSLDFQIKERDYKLQQQLTDEKLKQQILLAKQQQQQLELERQRAQIASKEKDLQKLTFLAKQAEMENQRRQQAALLKQEQLESALNEKLSKQQLAAKQTEINLTRKKVLFVSLAALLILGAAVFIFYSRRKTVRLNQIISTQKQSLEELVHVKDKIFSVVSHDMRNPINSLMAFTHLLDNGHIPREKMILYASELRNNLSYTSALMENLLNWAASQMQGFTPRLEWVNAGDMAQQVINSLHAAADRKQVTILNHILDQTMVWADKEMLSLILRNIISNAIKFSYQEGKLELGVLTQGDTIVLFIKDEGTGITAEKLEAINNNMHTAISSSYGTMKEKGTGLGLMLCKTFVYMMSAELIAVNNEDKGSTFQILFNKPAA